MSTVMETGTGVVNLQRSFVEQNGHFGACLSRAHICGYACCDFATLGNHIYTLPGELATARQQGLKFDHLEITDLPDGGADVNCVRLCAAGEFKSIDCMIHPLWPASANGTLFSMSDKRKCPIPVADLIEHAKHVQRLLLDWEAKFPGSLAAATQVGRKLTGHQAFPFRIGLDGSVTKLTPEQQAAICPPATLPSGAPSKYASVYGSYTGQTTPEDE